MVFDERTHNIYEMLSWEKEKKNYFNLYCRNLHPTTCWTYTVYLYSNTSLT